MVRKLLAREHSLFGISRTINQELHTLAKNKEMYFEHLCVDLRNIMQLEEVMASIFAKIEPDKLESICLINNAGMLTPIKTLEKCSAEEITDNLQLNLMAPLILTAAFLRHTKGLQTEKSVVNISSGAAKKPYAGWSCYCTAKAGLELFTQCVAAEQVANEAPVKMLSIIPGIIDTEMQAEIRAADVSDFPQVARFIGFKEQQQLRSSDEVAEKIVELLQKKELASGTILDLWKS